MVSEGQKALQQLRLSVNLTRVIDSGSCGRTIYEIQSQIDPHSLAAYRQSSNPGVGSLENFAPAAEAVTYLHPTQHFGYSHESTNGVSIDAV
jgi:hypothetical protein